MSIVERLNEKELQAGISDSASWHNDYKDTSWVRIRGLDSKLSEGDIICVFSQFGEIEDLDIIRDKKGFIVACHIKFEQFRSAVLTVDNFNNVTLLDRVLQVDHYRAALKQKKKEDVTSQELLEEVQPGRSFVNKEIVGEYTLNQGVDLYKKKQESPDKNDRKSIHKKRDKKIKKEKKERKHKRPRDEEDDDKD